MGEQRAAVGEWANKRALVEEEILRNIEVSRFQHDLGHRRYAPPADAEADIEATNAGPSEGDSSDGESDASEVTLSEGPSSPRVTTLLSAHSEKSIRARKSAVAESPTVVREALRVNVAQQKSTTANFKPRTVTVPKADKAARPALSDRISQLRSLHANYLA